MERVEDYEPEIRERKGFYIHCF